jgi:parallel beta-helix repeat protein
MKTKFHRLFIALALLALSTFNFQSSTAFAQGALTPPGAPAPTMLTLSQIEPRTPVDATHTGSGGSSEFLITQPGSYYLTTNIVGVSGENGINISANNVTLDLNGFSVQGISGAWSGIYIHAGYTNVTVRNGNISGWASGPTDSMGIVSGVECYANNVILECLNVSANHYGIYLDSSGVVRDCNCHDNAENGIDVNGGKVSGCEALNNAANGIYVITGTVSDCDALTNASYGIYVWTNCTVKDCTASGNLDIGIYVGNGCTIKDCTSGNNAFGINVAYNDSQIIGNNCSDNSEDGIVVYGTQNRIDSNIVGNNANFGIFVELDNVGNSITRNSAPGNSGGGYYGNSGNTDYAPVQTPSTATSPWANF